MPSGDGGQLGDGGAEHRLGRRTLGDVGVTGTEVASSILALATSESAS
jgi:hypothetical protein